MSNDTAKPAEKTIEVVLREFLEEQGKRLKPSTMCKYESIVSLFQSFLDGYGYQDLGEQEEALFDRLYNATGDEHREFCQIFGPEKIPDNVGEFLDYFMVRKVMCGKDLMRAAGTVMKKLGKWLEEKGYVEAESAAEVAHRGATAAKELPAVEEVARKLYDYESGTAADCDDVIEGYFTIDKVEAGKLHLSALTGDEGMVVSVSRDISDACREGWSISGAMGRKGKVWRIVEVWNVYP
ncbi:MAG: hypothetical protein JW741_16860 [Sedimentisphaerales bacterium]|nr:hypothetical protein [Sedimentisphaerales bacterium]